MGTSAEAAAIEPKKDAEALSVAGGLEESVAALFDVEIDEGSPNVVVSVVLKEGPSVVAVECVTVWIRGEAICADELFWSEGGVLITAIRISDI